MKETCVNVFAYGDEELVYTIGYLTYLAEGSYEDLNRLLMSKVDSDYRRAPRITLDSPMTWRDFQSSCRLGWLNGLANGSVVIPEGAVYCITSIVNGVVTIDKNVDHLSPEIPDYLKVYLTDAGLDIPRLIDDDFILAIKTLMNNEKYISALKLILSMIDTLGFIEFGPTNDCFVKWLDKYCAMKDSGVTSEELWELRNSLLHMTNLDSRKVRSGKVERLMPAFAAPEIDIPENVDGYKGFHVYRFVMKILPEGIKNWLQSYNENRDKFVDFVTRYDSVVSEARTVEQHFTK